MENESNLQLELAKIFLPKHLIKIKQMKNPNSLFVHYTSADVGLSIIKNQEIWMRNATCMKDFSEVLFGIAHVVDFFTSKESQPFWNTLDDLGEGFAHEVRENFDAWIPDLKKNTYLTCLSEHDPNKENIIGRLSMWREYGKPNGVALVINSPAILSEENLMNIFSIPVLYYEGKKIQEEFNLIVDNVIEKKELLKEIDRTKLRNYLVFILQVFSVSLKHHGFEEEREWRIVCRPNYWPLKIITPNIETIDGIPQTVYKIPFKAIPGKKDSVTISSLINRVIIGPTQFPSVIGEAFVKELGESGVDDAKNRVFYSDIPIRI